MPVVMALEERSTASLRRGLLLFREEDAGLPLLGLPRLGLPLLREEDAGLPLSDTRLSLMGVPLPYRMPPLTRWGPAELARFVCAPMLMLVGW